MAHHAGPPHQAGPAVALLVLMGLVGLGVMLPLTVGLRAHWRARRELRHCPVCGADAIRETASNAISLLLVQAAVQCGQCGTWRRLMRSPGEQRSLERRLDRDRRRMRRRAEHGRSLDPHESARLRR